MSSIERATTILIARLLIAPSIRHVDCILHLARSQLLANSSSIGTSEITTLLSIAMGLWLRRVG